MGSYWYPSATFYLLPSRAWELLIGALLAIKGGRLPVSLLTRETTGWLGLLLVSLPLFLYSEDTRFPGLAALPPCLGAALIIYSSESTQSFVGRLLLFKPVVFVGLISYSLYLWHWPVFVFSHYLAGGQRWPFRAALLVVSIVLAILSWRFIETPFRKRQVFHKRSRIFCFASASIGSLIIVGLVVVLGRGIPSRFSVEALRYANGRNDHAFRHGTSLQEARAGEFVELGTGNPDQGISVLIWGDSHAMCVTPVVDELCRKFDQRGIQAAQHGVSPILSRLGSSATDPKTFGEYVLSFVAEKKVKNVIITGHWKFYAKSDSFSSELVSTVKSFLDSGTRVYLMKDVPDQGVDVPRVAALVSMFGGDLAGLGVAREKHENENAKLTKAFRQISEMGATVLDPADCFLNERGLYGALKGGRALYTDGNHLTVEGARLLSPLFQPIFENHE